MSPDPLHYWHVQWSDWLEPIFFEGSEIPEGVQAARWAAESRTQPKAVICTVTCHRSDGETVRRQKKENAYQSLLAYLRGELREDQHDAA